jgi:hypothetical protein
MAQLKDLIVTGDTTIVGNESIGGITTSAGGFVGDLTGTASKAIGDKNGADITTTYYKASNPSGYTSNTGTITGVSVNSTSVATSGVANITSIPASILTGAIPSAVTATTQSQGNNSTKIATTAYVDTAITNLPEPMIFKGSLGTGGTITSLPTAAASNEGFTYKVITAGTYASQAAKVGDTFISDGSTWVLIPSGDEPSGTVTSITLKATSPIAIDSSSAITTSGTRTLSHANSGVTAGTYRSVTVNATGHVTAGTNPTTLSGYGITDALSKSGGAITGAITRDLGSGTIANTNLFTVSGSTDGFKVDYASTTADVGITTLSTIDDGNAKISIGNTVSSTYKEAISVTNGSAIVNGYTVAAASAKAVDTSISAASTSANLPTSAAVDSFVEGKGYVLKSGDTMTGALNFANNTANKVGDDVSFGDFNKGGMLGIIGQNGTTGIALIKNGST